MAKSTQTISHSINGFYDKEEGTIVKIATKEGEEDKTFYVENILLKYNGKEVTFTFKETSELESDE